MDSILNTIKKLLGIAEDYNHFDSDLIIHINSVFATLHQLGVGPSECFFIMDDDAMWGDFLQGATNLELVRTYIFLKVKLLFDPPLTSSVMEAMNRQISEFEWRLNVAAETSKSE